ncbi:MAG TPA: nitroreductase [Aeromicrobium sp.]|nr:nitroreductase [Aeromicrobium sp.]
MTDDAAALERLLTDRWSCRGFLDRQVDRAVIERLLTMAGRTPSWCNTQPWQVIVTEGAGTDNLRKAIEADTEKFGTDFDFPAGYNGVYKERRRGSGWQLYESLGIERGDREASTAQTLKNFEFFGAPHVAILSTEADLGVYGAVDCGLFVDTFLLAAQSLGLGAIAQAALAVRAPMLRDYFTLPERRRVLCAISFGYADTDHPTNTYRTSRVALNEFVTWA